MIEEVLHSFIFLQAFSSSISIGDLLNQWANLGFFQYGLPFILLFAIVYGILTTIKVFGDNKAIDAIIALSVGLMALQFGLVSRFSEVVFPRAGVGIMILLVILIIAGLFLDIKHSSIRWGLIGGSLIIALFVLINTSSELGWSTSYWWQDHWAALILGAVILIIIGAIVSYDSPSKPFSPIGRWTEGNGKS